MAKLSDFVSERTELDVVMAQLPDGTEATLRVVYDPTKVTPGTDERLRQYLADNDSLGAAKVLCAVLREWELEGPVFGQRVVKLNADGEPVEDGEEAVSERVDEVEVVASGAPVPITPEVVRWIFHGITLRIWIAVSRDALPKEMTSTS